MKSFPKGDGIMDRALAFYASGLGSNPAKSKCFLSLPLAIPGLFFFIFVFSVIWL